MTIQSNQIEALLSLRGYRVIHETSKKRGFQMAGNFPIYLNLQSKTGETALIAHPESGIESMRHQRPDLRVADEYFHSSNMREFPKRMHTGAQAISYGWGLSFDSQVAVEACLDHLEGNTPVVGVSPHAEPVGVELPQGTELSAAISRRVGHDRFKAALLDYWGGCVVTGLLASRLLRASHIKPWSSASSEEKTDPFNGLLLAPHFDAAFDAGLIAFNDQGQLLLSAELSRDDTTLLGIHAGQHLRHLDARHLPYLAFHRQEVFVH